MSISIKLSGDKRSSKALHHNDPYAEQQKLLDEERQLSYEDFMNRKIREAYFFNMSQAQERQKNREEFIVRNLRKNYERPPLHQNHNSFIHCSYIPMPSFIHFMNSSASK